MKLLLVLLFVSLNAFGAASMPHNFASQPGGNVPASYLDDDFALISNYNNYSNYLVDSGTANTYVVTFPSGTTGTLAAGLYVNFKAGNDNTGASTLAVNGLTAKNITNYDASALAAGQIQAGAIVGVIYDGTQFKLAGQSGGTVKATTFSGNLTGNVTGGAISGTTGAFSSTLAVGLANTSAAAAAFDGTNVQGTYIATKNNTALNSAIGAWKGLIGSGNATDTAVLAVGPLLGIAVNGGTIGTIIGIFSSTGLAVTGAITATGNITAYYSSDKRMKEHIKPIPDALSKVDKLTGVSFDWKQKYVKEMGRKHTVGVIAQDVEKVLPEAVTTRKDGMKAVRYELLDPLLIQAVKELSAKVDTLQKRVNELEARK